MALFILLSVILAAASSTVAQYPPDKEWGYQPYPPEKYPPDTYPPEPLPLEPYEPEPYPPPVEPLYPAEVYPPDGYPPQPDEWTYGEEPTWKLRLLVEERVRAQKEKIEEIKKYGQTTRLAIAKISTLSGAWCRSKYSVS